MEILLLVLFLAGVAIFAISRKPRRKRKRTTPAPPLFDFKVQPAPFDPSIATTTLEVTTLNGFAQIVDGDTLIIQKTQIRLFGIDAPELNHPFGKNAKWALVNLCKGKKIRAEITARDDYGRTVAHCYLDDGRDLSAEMVSLGLAIDWPKFSNGKYRELEAPETRRKLWLADARQKGHMHVWRRFEANQHAYRKNQE